MIVGGYYDANFNEHGFLRASDGSITTFDAPNAVNGTNPVSINPEDMIAGFYQDANFIDHVFLRASKGNIITFDASGAVNGTYAVSINPEGLIVGGYFDANSVAHGFLLARSGAITIFDAPGAAGGFGTFAAAMNQEGVVTGNYFQPIVGNPFGGNFRGLVRNHDGTFATFDAASYAPCCIWTFPSGITPSNTTTGSFNDGYNLNHGFLRASNGAITVFDAPGAGTGDFQGTLPAAITPDRVVVGRYFDAKNVAHGFLRIPCDNHEECEVGH